MFVIETMCVRIICDKTGLPKFIFFVIIVLMKETLKDTTYKIIRLLVAEKYSELEEVTNGVRLNATEIAKIVAGYGKKLVVLPEDGFHLMNVVEVKNTNPKRWSVQIPLWTQEEGRSDLTLEMTVIDQKKDFSIELDNIHVL